MVVAEAERVLAGVRVPTEQDFDDNASDWLRAGDLETLAAELIGRYGELAQLGDLRIRYAWKREGGGGESGKCTRLSSEKKWLSGGYDFFIWLAADAARELSPRQIEALCMHQLLHAGIDARGKTIVVQHDVELFYAELRRYGTWNALLEGAREVFQQLRMPL